jgi:Synergist-CTERM protein sorting domain-containing protein
VKAVEVEIPASSIKEVAASGIEEVRITTVIGEIVLDRTAIEALSDQAGAAVTLSIGKLDESAANANNLGLTQQQLSAIEADAEIREVFDVSLLVGGGHVTNFDKSGQKGALTISLPYELRSGETAGRVGVDHIAENGGITQVNGAKYSAGRVAFTTDHLSVYAVAYRAAETESDNTGGTSSGGCDAGFAGLALLVICAAMYRKRG